jgi:hypothetical protein
MPCDRDPGRRIPRGDRGGPEPVHRRCERRPELLPARRRDQPGRRDPHAVRDRLRPSRRSSSSSSKGLILWTVLRYRRRPGDDELPPQTHGNALAEALWTIIPSIIVAFLFVISWQTLNTVDAISAEPQMRARALAAQFQWQFDYYDESGENIVYTQLIPAGEGGGMALPVGKNIELVLESRDVIHAFYVPQFLFKRDVNPGWSTSSSSRSNRRTRARRSTASAPSCVARAIA